MRVHWYCLCDRDYCYFSGSNHQRACSRWALLICTIVGWWTFSSTFCNRRNKARTSDRPPGIRTRELKHGGDGCWHPLFPTFSARRVYEIFAVFKVLSFSTFRGFGVVFKTSVDARLLHTGKSGLRGGAGSMIVFLEELIRFVLRWHGWYMVGVAWCLASWVDW